MTSVDLIILYKVALFKGGGPQQRARGFKTLLAPVRPLADQRRVGPFREGGFYKIKSPFLREIPSLSRERVLKIKN